MTALPRVLVAGQEYFPLWLLCAEGMARMFSVTVTVSRLVTGDPSTSIDTMSTGRLVALGVQLKEKEVPVVRRVGLRGGMRSGGSAGHGAQNMHV